jgi:hypothetical protein
MNDVSRLEKALDSFQKNVDTSFAGPIPNSLLARQDLEQAIVVLTDRLTPFRDRVSRIKGEGLAHLWNQRTGLDTVAQGPSQLVNVFYADGNLPTQNDPAYVQKTAAYKYLGTTAVVTGPMIASGRSYMDIEAEVAEAALRLIIQAEEWADFNASSSVNSLAYNGLTATIATNVSDNAGGALTATGVVIPAFDKMIKRVRLQGGNKLDAIYLSFGLQAVVNQIVSPQTHYYINLDNPAGNMQAGDHVVSYASPIGSVPVIGDFFVNAALPYPATTSAGSSGSQGMPFSDVFFLRHDNQGLEMADLVPIGRTELAKIADTVRFYINEYTVLAPKAEPWLAMLLGVSDPTS